MGLLVELNSALGPSSRSIEQGMIYAINQANQAGGVHGHKIQYFVYDDQETTSGATTGFLQLVDVDHVTAMLGFGANVSLIAAGNEMQARNDYIPLIGLSDPNALPTGSPSRDWAYNAGQNITDSAVAQFNYLVEKNPGVTKVGVIYNPNAFGQGGLATVKQAAASKGVTVIGEPLSLTATDLTSTVSALKNAGAQGFLTYFDTNAAQITGLLRARQDLGWNVPGVIWSVYLDAASLKITDPLLNDIAASAFCNADATSYKQFATGIAPQLNFTGATTDQAAAAYVGAEVLLHAMSVANDPSNPAEVNTAIQQTQNFPSLCGTGTVTLSTTNHTFNPNLPFLTNANGTATYVVP